LRNGSVDDAPCGRYGFTHDAFVADVIDEQQNEPGVDAQALGLTFEALVFVTMRAADRDTVAAFERAVADVPHVLQAQRLFGDPDYLLRVIAADLPAFQRLYDEALSTLPGVQRLSSTLVMKSVVETRRLPL